MQTGVGGRGVKSRAVATGDLPVIGSLDHNESMGIGFIKFDIVWYSAALLLIPCFSIFVTFGALRNVLDLIVWKFYGPLQLLSLTSSLLNSCIKWCKLRLNYPSMCRPKHSSDYAILEMGGKVHYNGTIHVIVSKGHIPRHSLNFFSSDRKLDYEPS